jgi:glycosyltransferase involved in cell wall biosynthesis
MAARMSGVPQFYALMTGLGYVFSDDVVSWKRKLIRTLSVLLYRVGLAKAKKLFIYNPADEEDIVRYRMATKGQVLVPINGSGVDLTHFTTSPAPTDPVTFLFVSRLLREKGVREFVEAAADIRSRRHDVQFQILGPMDANPTSVSGDEIAKWERDGVVTYLGETRDVRPYLAACSVFVLPTYYREGIPRTILEALATGRAVITTNLPGCDKTVEDGVSGYLVEPRSVGALVNAMDKILAEPASVERMGKKSLALAQKRFDVHKINQKLLAEMGLV